MPKKNPDEICALKLHTGDVLFLRSGPTLKEIKDFVKINNERYQGGKAEGPSGDPSRLIIEAAVFSSEEDFYLDPSKGKQIALSNTPTSKE